MLKAKDLNPCYLVNFRCSVHGGIQYRRGQEDVEQEGQREKATWETVRVLSDKDEYKKATSLRGKCKREIEKLGVDSVLGVIMDKARIADLESTVTAYQEEIDAFNAAANFSTMRFAVVRFEVKGDNEVALESMLSDMRDTLDALREAVANADYKEIRKVIQMMKGYATVLPGDAAKQVTNAIDDARVQARQIRRALEKRGEQLEEVQNQVSTASVDMARFALLDTESTDSAEDNGEADGDDLGAAMAGVRAAAVFYDADEDTGEGDADSDDSDDADPFDGLMGSPVPDFYGVADTDDA